MYGSQMTIFDIIYPEKLNPIREVAKRSGAYWKSSREKLIEYCNKDPDIRDWAKAVRHEYCPYDCSGHYGGDGTPNTLQSWDMRPDLIKVIYYDETGQTQTRMYSWEDFAREIADLIWSHEYTGGYR